ncbi:MAG: ATP-binding protein [Proteobacteria bacterium]|nr:ATP-binding protein [Pseudomonadota bacterium]
MELFRLRLPNRVNLLRVARAAARAAGEEFRFPEKTTGGMELVVEEAASNVLRHAYSPNEEAYYYVSASLEGDALVFRVQDKGMPMDSFDLPQYDPLNPDSKGLGTYLMKTYCDGFRYLNLGKEGKAFEFLFHLPREGIGYTAEPVQTGQEPMHITDKDMVIRPFLDEDAPQVARCVYQAYRYSYLRDFLYIPEQLIRVNRSGEIRSIVAVLADGSVIGHIALMMGQNRRIAESGQAFVSPLVRGAGIYKRLKQAAIDYGTQWGLDGYYALTVTVHPYTQKVNLEFGARESGIHLSYSPAGTQFEGIKGKVTQRIPVVIFYGAFHEECMRRIFVPPHHRAMITRIYENLNIPVEVSDSEPVDQDYNNERTVFDFKVNQNGARAYVHIRAPGRDLSREMRNLLRLFHDQGIELVLAELPLGHPSVAIATANLEALGFFFSGVLPHGFEESDALCLQYLRIPELRTDNITIYSPFSRELLDYMLREAKGRVTVINEEKEGEGV